ncbi:MAG TPA: ATP-binding protein [Steroidobacteraceae bacterium]|nr:ATP-binding protein [Steroidobacteraceae bacterium]
MSKDAVIASTTPAKAERPWSLRRRMAIAVAAAACMVFLILGLLVYRAVASSTAAQFDEMLQQQASLALRYADHEYDEGESVVPRSLGAAVRATPLGVVYQIITRTNQLLYRSPGTPQAPLAIGNGPGYSNAVLDGRSWRVYSLNSATTPLVIHIAEPLEYRDAALSRTLHAVALPLLFALVLLTFLIGVVTERAFRPVRRMAADLAGRGADDLSAVNTAEMPVETHALGVALNGLLARHAEVLARERRFTADAAHELRTPLAALRAQAQVAARATTPSEARRALDKLQANIDRTAHLMSQLLSLARLEPGSSFSAGQTTQAKVVVDLVLEDLAQTAREKRIEIMLEGCLQRLPGSPEVLYLLIRNLLENSIRHVSERGQVALTVIERDQSAVLSISDNGPGIPIAERSRALERFYRIPGSASSGSGLGLSIVGRVVELLAGEIELADPAVGTGLVVTVRLPFTGAQIQDQTAA